MTRAFVLVLAIAACGTPPPSWEVDGGSCVPYVVPTNLDLMNPVVSFKNDVVMNVFNKSCGTSSCHGSTSQPTGGVFLGASTAKGKDAAVVHAALVDKPSGELASMKFVTPNDPTRSYLMHKLDGDQCVFESSCTGQTCQHSMPSQIEVLMAVSTRDTVRRWIAQGAANN